MTVLIMVESGMVSGSCRNIPTQTAMAPIPTEYVFLPEMAPNVFSISSFISYVTVYLVHLVPKVNTCKQ
jgi:hypothetical protein